MAAGDGQHSSRGWVAWLGEMGDTSAAAGDGRHECKRWAVWLQGMGGTGLGSTAAAAGGVWHGCSSGVGPHGGGGRAARRLREMGGTAAGGRRREGWKWAARQLGMGGNAAEDKQYDCVNYWVLIMKLVSVQHSGTAVGDGRHGCGRTRVTSALNRRRCRAR